MRRGSTALILLLLCSSPADAQGTIHIRVENPRTGLIPSEIQFRRSSTGSWEVLERAERGEAVISFGCAPGTQLRADPLNGRYTNSGALPCRPSLVLQVAERGVGFAADAVSDRAELSRAEFAVLLAHADHDEDGEVTGMQSEDALVERYLHKEPDLESADREAAEVRMLNESSTLFDKVDRNHDEKLSSAEIERGPE